MSNESIINKYRIKIVRNARLTPAQQRAHDARWNVTPEKLNRVLRQRGQAIQAQIDATCRLIEQNRHNAQALAEQAAREVQTQEDEEVTDVDT